MRTPPDPVLKPKLAGWMFDRNITVTSAAGELKCSKQTISNITQPFASASRTVPHQDLLERIVAWTGGEVTAGDFYPPHLNGSETHAVREVAQ
jgi:hypothetical protein